MKDKFNVETKEEIKRNIDLGFIRLASELKEDIDNEFIKANERLINQQVLINTLDDRIDKAIEYIEQLPFSDLVPLEVKIIYGILKGSDTNV